MSLHIDIVKRFPAFDLAVQLDAGNEVMGLLGASGCGKSVTLRSVAGLVTPDEGRIVVNDQVLFDSAAHINLKPQQRRTAMLFQNYQLFPNMSVITNVEAGMDRKLSRSERRRQAQGFLEMFGLSEFADRYPMRLSGGQQQRVALARMLAARPSILMFDEPFSALDAHLKSALEQSMLDTFDDIDATILYVSHDIDEALRFCDRISVMDHGEVTQVATGPELVHAPASLAAIRLSGCKNTSRARKVGEHRVEALDWGMTFDVPGEIPDDVVHLGIRAFYIHEASMGASSAAGEGAREANAGPTDREANVFDLHVHRVSDSRFERTVMLDTPAGDATHRIQWKVDTLSVASDARLPEAGDTLRLQFDAKNLYLVCR